MKLKWILPLVIGVTVLAQSGCIDTLDGRKKAGWPLTKDIIEGRYERSPAELWSASKDVLKHQGTLISEDTLKNVLEASVDERRIWVKIEEFDTRVSRVLVQARTKGGSADLEMAAYIDKQIAVRLASNNLTPAAPRR
jgi:hypothetical protein